MKCYQCSTKLDVLVVVHRVNSGVWQFVCRKYGNVILDLIYLLINYFSAGIYVVILMNYMEYSKSLLAMPEWIITFVIATSVLILYLLPIIILYCLWKTKGLE